MTTGSNRGATAFGEEPRGCPDALVRLVGGIREQEHHFNGLETQIRQLASGWLLATLGAVAYLVKTGIDPPDHGPSPLLLIGVVCLMGVIGLTILWVLDQLVYHRLLNSSFLLGLFVEYRNPWLPPERALMLLYSRRRGMARYLRIYYFASMLVLTAIGVAAGLARMRQDVFAGRWSLVPGLVAAGAVVLSWWWQRRLERYSEVAEGFGDPGFVRLLREERFDEMVLRAAPYLWSDAPAAAAASRERPP